MHDLVLDEIEREAWRQPITLFHFAQLEDA